LTRNEYCASNRDEIISNTKLDDFSIPQPPPRSGSGGGGVVGFSLRSSTGSVPNDNYQSSSNNHNSNSTSNNNNNNNSNNPSSISKTLVGGIASFVGLFGKGNASSSPPNMVSEVATSDVVDQGAMDPVWATSHENAASGTSPQHQSLQQQPQHNRNNNFQGRP